jgi:hypothetical protein
VSTCAAGVVRLVPLVVTTLTGTRVADRQGRCGHLQLAVRDHHQLASRHAPEQHAVRARPSRSPGTRTRVPPAAGPVSGDMLPPRAGRPRRPRRARCPHRTAPPRCSPHDDVVGARPSVRRARTRPSSTCAGRPGRRPSRRWPCARRRPGSVKRAARRSYAASGSRRRPARRRPPAPTAPPSRAASASTLVPPALVARTRTVDVPTSRKTTLGRCAVASSNSPVAVEVPASSGSDPSVRAPTDAARRTGRRSRRVGAAGRQRRQRRRGRRLGRRRS